MLSCSYGETAFAIKIRQNPAMAGFGKSKSGTTLVFVFLYTAVCFSLSHSAFFAAAVGFH